MMLEESRSGSGQGLRSYGSSPTMTARIGFWWGAGPLLMENLGNMLASCGPAGTICR